MDNTELKLLSVHRNDGAFEEVAGCFLSLYQKEKYQMITNLIDLEFILQSNEKQIQSQKTLRTYIYYRTNICVLLFGPLPNDIK